MGQNTSNSWPHQQKESVELVQPFVDKQANVAQRWQLDEFLGKPHRSGCIHDYCEKSKKTITKISI